jgi:hypothetical protein
MRGWHVRSIVAALAWLALSPTAARAQSASAIAGVVKDSSGAVLPGVTIEVSSPVLIERVRTVVADEHGEYKVVDLRPGTYSIAFSLEGFGSVRREGFELPANFTATVNAELHVGTLEETVTVTGGAPIVDVENTSRTQVLTRDLLDAVPGGRTAQAYEKTLPNVTMSAPDVGGAQAMNQAGAVVHGLLANNAVVLLDGIQLNGMCGDGSTQSYANVQGYQEIVFETSGAGADVSAGGVRQNMVPNIGGNQFHGSFAGVGSRHTWQATAITPDLVARGLTIGNSLDGAYDFETGLGGKLVQDKLWWFGAARRISANTAIADTFYSDGSQGVSDQYVMNGSMRLTGQLDAKNKLTVYADRVSKYEGHDMLAGYDPATASRVWEPSKLYMQAEVKWTSTPTNKLLIEAGTTYYNASRHTTYQPGVEQPFGTDAWVAGATHNDLSLGTVTNAAPGGDYFLVPERHFFSGSVSYVTGSHAVKLGAQDTWGFLWQGTELNAGLIQNYQNGAPTSVSIYNTPEQDRFNMNAQWALFAQDSWTLKRATINYGARWEYYKSSVAQEESGLGRFVPDRPFPGQTMPIWKTLSPLFGFAYDLLGNARTALKFSVNRYQQSQTGGQSALYNPMRLQSATLTWNDLNHDSIAQGAPGCVFGTPGCEINFAQTPANFGIIPAGCSLIATPGSIPCGTDQVDPNIKRQYNTQWGLGVQHALLPRVSITANWFHTDFSNLFLRPHLLPSYGTYTAAQIVSPLDGHLITIYNVSAAARSQVLNVHSTAPSARQWDNALEFGSNARLPGGATIYGGVTTERTLVVNCDSTNNPNNLLYCDQTQSGIPWLTTVKLSGTMPLPWGLKVSASFQTYQYVYANGTGIAEAINANPGTVWFLTPTTRYAANCIGPCTPGALVDPGMTVASLSEPLVPPGTEKSDRIKQLDLTVGKWMTFGKVRLQPELSVFNLLNNIAVYAVRSMNYGTSSYLQPSTTLQPRLLRLGVQVKW